MTTQPGKADSPTNELTGPIAPSPGVEGLWKPMDCSRCGEPITTDDVWYLAGDPDEDGPVFHERCVVG